MRIKEKERKKKKKNCPLIEYANLCLIDYNYLIIRLFLLIGFQAPRGKLKKAVIDL